MDLQGKTALIVGAGRGIGRAVSDLFAESNANLVISSRNVTELLELDYKLASKGMGEILVCKADVTNEDEVETLINTSFEKFGQIDYLIFSAGFGKLGKFEDISTEQFRELVETNTISAYGLLQKVLPRMKEARSGRVVAIPGVLGKAPMANAAAYCGAKFGLTGLIKALKEEYKRFGIRFSLMHFGGVDTTFWDEAGMKVDREKLLTANVAAKACFEAATQEGVGVMSEVVLMPESHQIL